MSEPRRWQPFAANRGAQIQELTPNVHWNFVSGTENPADRGTRGIPPTKLESVTCVSMDPIDSQNHPIILPKTDHVVNLIFTDYPLKLLRAGPQLLQAALREKFWTLLVLDVVRRVVRRCIPCFRIRPRFAEQFMGDLPESRVCSSSVFQRTGDDFAGPFLIRSSKGRGSHNTKRNICVFVCLATKAVHLEVVSNLTSEILCDKGTNFYGASTYLRKEFYQLLKEDAVHKLLVTDNIT
ncbi:integrase catalytic domain-containing protein [Trichonephila clavipes]|uniref:Integrase catalytic domain-containing protein n=1 Tax=Trichonephila clavipes TaxID=2585209 RepID=A0A8X6VGU8_TRICX|nr:integrase catalytic domain-containing protein [Trichonephila clavipes]